MDYLPIFLRATGRRALVIGGGAVAARKTEWLRRAGMRVTVVAPRITDELTGSACAGEIEHRAREFLAGDIRDCALVIAATDDVALNRRVHFLAISANIPVNVVDCPELCTFIVPAVVDRSPVVVAISSGGAAPVLVRMLRAQLEVLLPRTLGRLARLAASFRPRVKQRLPDPAIRRRFWERLFDGGPAERLCSGDERDGERMVAHALDDAAAGKAERGVVYLVGAGPGDPELMTMRALRLLQQADVVLHDRLVAPEVLELARRDAERIDVGKRCGERGSSQDTINGLMVGLARAGRRVVRLKSGDPLMFARGGEEMEYLAAHDVPFQVVPGVTAGLGCAAYAGIPLTHRDHAQSCVFVTGHGAQGEPDFDWGALAQKRQTLVVYVGLGAIPRVSAGLRAHGVSPDMPIALIENGSRPDQRVLVSTLANVSADIVAADLSGPVLIIIGTVVALRDRLSWFSGGGSPVAREYSGAIVAAE